MSDVPNEMSFNNKDKFEPAVKEALEFYVLNKTDDPAAQQFIKLRENEQTEPLAEEILKSVVSGMWITQQENPPTGIPQKGDILETGKKAFDAFAKILLGSENIEIKEVDDYWTRSVIANATNQFVKSPESLKPTPSSGTKVPMAFASKLKSALSYLQFDIQVDQKNFNPATNTYRFFTGPATQSRMMQGFKKPAV